MYIYNLNIYFFLGYSMEINSLYSWPKMSQEEFDNKYSIIRLIVEDYIRLNDWFSQFNELINQENKNPSSEVYLEGQLNGLLPIFILGGGLKTNHIERF